jgi:hypothetical protein
VPTDAWVSRPPQPVSQSPDNHWLRIHPSVGHLVPPAGTMGRSRNRRKSHTVTRQTRTDPQPRPSGMSYRHSTGKTAC